MEKKKGKISKQKEIRVKIKINECSKIIGWRQVKERVREYVKFKSKKKVNILQLIFIKTKNALQKVGGVSHQICPAAFLHLCPYTRTKERH